jgi:YidC/Oxa1 family membrane protein insertase
VFALSTVDGQANSLMAHELFRVALGAHGLAAGWVLVGLLALLAVVATVSARRLLRLGQPKWLAILPYGTVVFATTVPLAVGLYLLTSTAWSALETAVLRRDMPTTTDADSRRGPP